MNQSHILVVDDEPDIRELVQEILEDEGYTVSTAENGEVARTAFARDTFNLVLLDIWMPDVDGITLLKEWASGNGLECPVVVMSGHGSLETAIEATRLGAFDFVQKPISLAKLLSIVSRAIESAATRPPGSPENLPSDNQPIGNSAVMQLLRSRSEQAATQDLPVLITGEKGSGRDALARFIHQRSRRQGDFVVIDPLQLETDDCLAYLLGHESGDEISPGVLEQAAGGTLYIPELEDLPPGAQKALNRVLDAEKFSREGGKDNISLNVRLIASGDQSLLQLAAEDETLQQLYYRLNVLPLGIPPLRERADDIPELVRFYAEWFPNREEMPYRPFSVAAQNRLRNHEWPGNIRELKNLIQQLLVLGGEGEVSVAEVEQALLKSPGRVSGQASDFPQWFDLPLREAREQFEREYLTFKLRQCEGSVGRLAEAVGMERTHLYRKLRSLSIDAKAVAKGSSRK